MMKLRGLLKSFTILGIISVFCVSGVFAQKATKKTDKPAPVKKESIQKTSAEVETDLPKVTQIDEIALAALLKREGENPKPLLINFWATWCGPCVEEFPDLVEIDNHYKGKIDFITITFDDIEELNTGVPKFLKRMNANMPTYLLQTEDQDAAITSVYEEWSGALPFTIFLDGKGKIIYNIQGKIVVKTLKEELDKATSQETK